VSDAAQDGLGSGLRRLGAFATGALARLGYSARFFVAILLNTPSAFRRLHLTLREIYFSGVLSLIIILVSGLFVGRSKSGATATTGRPSSSARISKDNPRSGSTSSFTRRWAMRCARRFTRCR